MEDFKKYLKENQFKPMVVPTENSGVMLSSYYINPKGEIIQKSDNDNLVKKIEYKHDKDGYNRQSFSVFGEKQRRFFIHRLVGLNYIPNPHNLPCINHINRDVSDNRVENLEWVSVATNAEHAKRTKHLYKPKCKDVILQLELIGNNTFRLINEYKSKRDIPTYIDNRKVDKQKIVSCCNEWGVKTHHDYYWIYKKNQHKFNII